MKALWSETPLQLAMWGSRLPAVSHHLIASRKAEVTIIAKWEFQLSTDFHCTLESWVWSREAELLSSLPFPHS